VLINGVCSCSASRQLPLKSSVVRPEAQSILGFSVSPVASGPDFRHEFRHITTPLPCAILLDGLEGVDAVVGGQLVFGPTTDTPPCLGFGCSTPVAAQRLGVVNVRCSISLVVGHASCGLCKSVGREHG
jgi:hypothetical protein